MSDKIDYKGSSYSKFRPTYSDLLYSLIYKFHQGDFDLAADIGTGTGQAAIDLSTRFKHVYGIDPLPEMIDNAIKKDNVTFRLGNAEFLDFDDHSVDMVTASTAFHWFNHTAFFDQVKRVLKKDGTLAVWGYYFPVIKNNEEATRILEEGLSLDGPLQRYCDPNVKYIINMYRDFTFPFKTVEYYISPSSKDVTGISQPCHGALMEKTMSLDDFERYLKTASAYVAYTKDPQRDPIDPVDNIIEKLSNLLQSKDNKQTFVDLEWPVVLVLCKDQ